MSELAPILVFGGLGVLMAGAALYWIYSRRRFAATASRTMGTVVRLEEIPDSDNGLPTFAPVVAYTPEGGLPVMFVDSFSSRPARHFEGQRVAVLYDPVRPAAASVAGFGSLYVGPMILLGIGLGFTAFGVGFLVMAPKSADVAPLPGVELSRFVGEWSNLDGATGGITRVSIHSEKRGLNVGMWGRCKPSDCAWGSPVAVDLADAGIGVVRLQWKTGFAVREQRANYLDDGRLQLITRTKFIDRSGRQDYETTDYFSRDR